MAQFTPTPLSFGQPANSFNEVDIAGIGAPTESTTGFGEALDRGIATGTAVAKGAIEAQELEQAKRFEKVLQAGLPAMEETLQEMENEGYDLTGVRDPQLFLRSTDDIANWYKEVKGIKDRQDKERVNKEQATAVKEGRVEDFVASAVEHEGADPANAYKVLDQLLTSKKSKETLKNYSERTTTSSVSNDTLSLIRKGEGSYDAYNTGKAGKTSGVALEKPIDQMTITEIMEKQKNTPLFAVGAYQFIPETLKTTVDSLGIDANSVFSKEVQDQLASELISGKDTMSLAKTFASIGVPEDTVNDRGVKIKKGESYYKDRGGNKAFISPEEIETSLASEGGFTEVTKKSQADLGSLWEEFIAKGLNNDPTAVKAFQQLKDIETMRQKKDIADKKANAKAIGKVKKLDPSLEAGVNSIIALAQKVPAGEGFLARLKGMGRSLGAWMGEAEDTKNLADFRRGLAAKVARGVSGEGSRLTDQDIERALVMIPGQYDTIPERDTKIAILQGLVSGDFIGKSVDEVYADIGLRVAEARSKANKEGQSTGEPVNLNPNQTRLDEIKKEKLKLKKIIEGGD